MWCDINIYIICRIPRYTRYSFLQNKDSRGEICLLYHSMCIIHYLSRNFRKTNPCSRHRKIDPWCLNIKWRQDRDKRREKYVVRLGAEQSIPLSWWLVLVAGHRQLQQASHCRNVATVWWGWRQADGGDRFIPLLLAGSFYNMSYPGAQTVPGDRSSPNII